MFSELQAINSLVGWYEESNASDAIKASRKNLAPVCNFKRSGEWIVRTRSPMDCCVKFTLFLVAVSLILVCFIMAVLLSNTYGLLKMLGVCVVLLVASIPIAMQVVCTSTMALSCFVRETSHFVLVGIHRGTFWNGHIVLRQVRQAHTEHHDCRVEASVV